MTPEQWFNIFCGLLVFSAAMAILVWRVERK